MGLPANQNPPPQPPANTDPLLAQSTASTSAAQPPAPPANSPAALDLAAKIFDLARTGATDSLSAYLTAGIPQTLPTTPATPSSCSPPTTTTSPQCASSSHAAQTSMR
ncbi:hypothetical protein H2199_007424 [Coniosporium tulheliwenetii]|uniref:Uncharacterized protein n=1 Tax=Coniosporium tulheliwenetii TaxID=3383036 RepID=A0ACC2YP44_9PEZI|nr:hypothetical protein H2199_007424 [Cladosporium sp. JES 115]